LFLLECVAAVFRHEHQMMPLFHRIRCAVDDMIDRAIRTGHRPGPTLTVTITAPG
jgi:hypothetical protein